MDGKSVFRTEAGRKIVQERYEDILKNWPVPCERRYIDTEIAGEPVCTHAVISGPADAPPLLLLHGTLSNSAAWLGDVADWSREFRLIAADVPGEPGFSSDRRPDTNGNEYCLWLEGLLDALGYGDTGVSLIGQSLGAFAALKFAIQRPERVKTVSMLTVSGIAPQRINFLFRAVPLMLLGKWGADRLNKIISFGVDTGAEAMAFGALVSKHCRPITGQIPLFTEEELARLTMPLQYFGGDHDVLLDTEKTADRLRDKTERTEINILRNTGHIVIRQTEKVLEFLREYSSNEG